MPKYVVFELLFVRRATFDEPICPGIAHAIAEQQVQAPADFVDEVVHVAFQRAVVIAGEKHLLSRIDEDPAGEMNRLYPGEVAAVVEVPPAVIDHGQQRYRGPAPKQPGFQAADDDVWIGRVVILVPRDLGAARSIRTRQDL